MFASDDDLLPVELLEAVERSYGILIVVGNGYPHASGFTFLLCGNQCNNLKQ
jgi:hypothetical protein